MAKSNVIEKRSSHKDASLNENKPGQLGKVMFIEDNFSIIDIYTMAFKAAQIELESITLGKIALKKIEDIQKGKAEKPALVLLDLMLPDINGLEILLKIRENSATKDLKVWILSNYTSESLLNINYIKPDKFLLKTSITPSQLIEMIKKELS